MDPVNLVDRIRDYRFQAIVGLAAVLVAAGALSISGLLAFGITALGIAAVVVLSVLDHRYRVTQRNVEGPVREVALAFPDGVNPADVEIEKVLCTVRRVRDAQDSRTVHLEAYLGPGGWLCPLPETTVDEVVLIRLEAADGRRWRISRFSPDDLTPRVAVVLDNQTPAATA